MELGTSQPFWTLKYALDHEYITETWVTNIWDYLCQCGIKMVDNEHWVYQLPRINDFHIMDVVFRSGLSKHHISIFNQIRMYMHAITASDVYDVENMRFKANVYNCEVSLLSSLGWPRIQASPPSWIRIWQTILNSIILPKIKANPIGKWICTSHLVG